MKHVFGLALECEPAGRDALLQEACKGDELLQAEVKGLLVAAEGGEVDTCEVFSAMGVQSRPGETEDPMLGRRIGAYRIEQRIGFGGMASVYRASRADDEFRKQVAIKLLRPDLDNEDLLRRFRIERQTLAVLDHPNVVKLLDGGTTEEGLPYLVMDYVDGCPINEYCDSHKLSIVQRLHLFIAVCEAVRAAHKNQVIHRDLKPSNILVTTNGSPRLLDFGIAKVLSVQNTTEDLITRTITRHLTPAYASPEQVRGEIATAATDVYSLGVVLYELLTGRRPYRLKQCTSAEVERAICEQEPESPSAAIDRVETEEQPDGTTATRTAETVSRTREGEPRKLRRRLRGDLDTILLKALQKERQRRYASVEAFEQDVANYLEHRPIKASRNTLIHRAFKFVRRHKTQAIPAAMVLLILLAAVGFSIHERRVAMRARAEVANQRSRGRRSVAVLGFKNLSARADAAWITTALSETLTTELAAGGSLRTIPTESVARTKISLSLPEVDSFSEDTLSRLRKGLGCDFVVVGSYLEVGDAGHDIRLDLRLQDAVLGETLASLVESGSETDLSDLVIRAGADLREKLGAGADSTAGNARAQAVLPSNPIAAQSYAEGLAKLRALDALSARNLLEKAVASDPTFAMAHSALSDAWTATGYDAKAKDEAKKALVLASNLPREQSLLIEAQYAEASKDWNRTTDIYQTLFNFFPDNLDYGLRLAGSQISNTKTPEALVTLESLRHLPTPSSSDPRIDLVEARAAVSISDYRRAARVSADAGAKALSLGMHLLRAEAKLDEGNALEALGDPKKATAALEESRRLFVASGDRFGEAKALRDIGGILLRQGDFPSAKTSLEDCLGRVRQIGNRAAEADVLGLLFQLHYHQGDLVAANQIAQENLAVARELNDKTGQARALNWIASLENDQEQFSVAEKHYEESLSIARASGNQSEIASVLDHLGTFYINEGDYARARSIYEECLKLSRRTGNKSAIGHALVNLSGTSAMVGEFGPAKALAAQAVQIFKNLGDQVNSSYALYTLAVIEGTQDDLTDAWADQQEALAIRERIGAETDAANSRFSLSELALERGRALDAEHLASEAAEYFHKEKLPSREGDAYRVLAESLCDQGRLGEAKSAVMNAQAILANGEPVSRARVTIADARVLAASGNPVEALNLLEKIVKQAKKERWLDVEFEARLAIGGTLRSNNPAAARVQLRALEKEAKAKGYLLTAQKARKLNVGQ